MIYNLFILALYSSGAVALPQKELALEQTSCVKPTNPNDGSSMYSHECKARSKRDTDEDHMFGYSFTSYAPTPKKVSEEEHIGNSIEGKFHDQQSELEYDPIDEVYHHYPSFDSYDGYEDDASDDIEDYHFPSHIPFLTNPSPIQPSKYSHETTTFGASYPAITRHYNPIEDMSSSQASADETIYPSSSFPADAMNPPLHQESPKSITITQEKIKSNQETANDGVTKKREPIKPSQATDKPSEVSSKDFESLEASSSKASGQTKDPEEGVEDFSADKDSTETEETEEDGKDFSRPSMFSRDTIDWA
ncbi:hypothetical protein DSO57_1008036 [Entomophthora muscae]|uniref:Uncharacterized protein n=1 Tax=Entomophthora muscae TaxID=34485 RepID=A0ACC2USY6_9FUNG|nr:hypothetical protein DSO57_1008036 [Entomophthora muscae]